VYVLALLSAVRILEGATREMAALTFVLVVVLAGFSGWYLAVPIVAAVAALGVRAVVRTDDAGSSALTTQDRPDCR
jgi:type II secretory pathway component PulF